MAFFRRYRWLLSAAAVIVVTLAIVGQLGSIDWDIGQRRNQKMAFLRLRYLAVSLQAFKDRNGQFPLRLEDVHDDFVITCAASGKSFDREYPESTWRGIADPEHTWGYIYDYSTPDDSVAPQHYELRASPIERGRTGFRYFYMSATSSIRWNDEHRASPADPEPKIDPALDMHSYWRERLHQFSVSW